MIPPGKQFVRACSVEKKYFAAMQYSKEQIKQKIAKK